MVLLEMISVCKAEHSGRIGSQSVFLFYPSFTQFIKYYTHIHVAVKLISNPWVEQMNKEFQIT